MKSLPLFHRISGTRVVVVGDGPMVEAKRRLVERAGGICCSEAEAHHARLGFVAFEDAREADTVARRLKGKGLLVNVADRPELCDFTLPSILERDPVLVAIGTAGASAGLAKHLRLRLEGLLPHTIGKLAQALAEGREALRAKFPNVDERRRALDEALAEGGTLDVLGEDSVGRVDAWLGHEATPQASHTVEIDLTSDDPEDLSLRQARLLGMADAVLHDPAVPSAILDRARADALRRELPCEAIPTHGLTVVIRTR